MYWVGREDILYLYNAKPVLMPFLILCDLKDKSFKVTRHLCCQNSKNLHHLHCKKSKHMENTSMCVGRTLGVDFEKMVY